MPSDKKQLVARVSDEGWQIIDALRRRYGFGVSAAVEFAIRRAGQAEGIETDEQTGRAGS